MADLADVTDALATIVGATLYPAGASGEMASPVAGVPVIVIVGWPDPQKLDIDLKALKTTVAIYPQPRERNTTRYPKEWKADALKAATFALTRTGQNITVTGTQPSPFYPQNFAVFLNSVPYLYQALTTDAPADIASGLAAVIDADFPSVSTIGASLQIPAGVRIGDLRVGTLAQVTKEVRRQERIIRIMIWAPDPRSRDAVARAFDPVLADTPRLTLADGTLARLIYSGSPFSDFDQKQGIFRRDFDYLVEYPTIRTDTAPEAIAAKTVYEQLNPDGSVISPPIRTLYN